MVRQEINFFEEATSENFNENELEILQPFIEILQHHFSKISASTDVHKKDYHNKQSLFEVENLLLSIQPELSQHTVLQYNYTLINIKSLDHFSSAQFSTNDATDILDIFQETIDLAHEEIQNLINLSNDTENQLAPLSINKIKIVKFIYRMVQKVYALGIRAGRAAYCTYSSIPAINSTLKELDDIGSCYNYTETSVVRLRNDVKSAIADIRANVEELIGIYRKLAKRHSLLGKLLTIILNVQKVSRDIKETSSLAKETIKEVKTDGPIIASKAKECAITSVPSFIRNLNETLSDLNTCISYVDNSTQGPEPEPESFEETVLLK